MIPKPRYAIGDKVWSVDTSVTMSSLPCPDCLGSKEWTATSPAGDTFRICCLRCSTSYPNFSRSIPPLTFQQSTYSARELTIGSVRIDTAETRKGPVSYMCNETGVGSGRIYDECDLFLTEADARHAAMIKTIDEQARLDAMPINTIRREAAAWPLSAAFPHVWQEEIYHAWDRYRDLSDAAQELINDEDHVYDLSSDAVEKLRDALESKPWRRPQPVEELLAAIRAHLGAGCDGNLARLEQAVWRCTPPEHREAVVVASDGT